MKTDRLHSFTLAAALAACFLTAGRASAVPAITNGSFEDPAEVSNSITEITATGVPGWTGDSIGGAAHEYVINGNVQDGSGRNFGVTPFGQQYLGLNAIANRSFRSIESQTVTSLVIGQAYALTLYIANLDGASDPNVSVEATNGTDGSGDSLASQLFSAPAREGPYGNGAIDFVPETLTFTAESDAATFSIGNQSKTGVLGIDNVSLAAVPEPTTTAAMLLGTTALAGMVLCRRRLG